MKFSQKLDWLMRQIQVVSNIDYQIGVECGRDYR